MRDPAPTHAAAGHRVSAYALPILLEMPEVERDIDPVRRQSACVVDSEPQRASEASVF